MNRLREAFTPGRALLMPFLVAGYPSEDAFGPIVDACVAAGADVLEIGLPFSDPVMDGPVIAAASQSVLDRGATFDSHLKMLTRAASAGVPCVAMTYYNLLLRRGLVATAATLAAAGATAVIVPDLPVEAAADWRAASASAGLACVFLAAQTSPDERLRAIGEASTGFVYAASLLGVTGTRDSLDAGARVLVDRLRSVTDAPIALGIGVSDAEQARAAAAFADGVIVGSALVARLGDEDPAAAAAAFVGSLREALDAAGGSPIA